MTTTKRLLASCCTVAALAVSANAQVVFEWVPAGASGSFQIAGNQIILDGGGQTVTLHFRVSAWDPNQIGTLLGSYQGTVNPDGYLGQNATPPNPGVDLNPVGNPATRADGAFQAVKVCSDDFVPPLFETFDPLSSCTTNSDCPAGFACVDRPDWVFAGVDFVPTVTFSTLFYAWSAASTTCSSDPDGGATTFYGGTLILEVPAGARGTYTIDFLNNPNFTLAAQCSGILLSNMTLTPALISISCASGADCDDGNACTTDVCEADKTCSNTPVFNEAVECCDPATGNITVIDDGNECTADACDAVTGQVSHTPTPGVSCGGVPTGQCDAQDTCDGTGACVANFAPPGTGCGSAASSECDSPDSCDGAGTCNANNQPAGTPCGDGTQTQCDNPDSCNGSGACLTNFVAPGTPCDDGLFCTIDESCSGGTCGGGGFTCDDGVGCTDDTCDEAADTCANVANDQLCNNGQFCDGVEICDPALDCVVQAGTVPDCNDGVSCTNDSCDEGNDVCVNAPNNANCNNGLFCDGVEICDPVLNCITQAGSVPDCADTVACTDDSCDEANDTCVNAPNDQLCPDDGLFCNGPEICDPASGCTSAGCPCGTDCAIACDEVNDTCLCDPPLAEAVGGRYVKVEPRPAESTAPQAIVLTPYCPTGIARYVGPPQPFDIDGDQVPDGSVAFVVDDPADAAWLLPAEWNPPVYVTGLHVVPGTEFVVQGDCGSPGAPSFSEPATATTYRWGDVTNDPYVNVVDTQRIQFGMQDRFDLNSLPNLDLWGGGAGQAGLCGPNQFLNVTDLQQQTLSMQGAAYTHIGCPIDCPPCIAEVHCNDGNACTIDACDANGGCVHTLIHDPAVTCCNTASGALTPIDDADPCTIDTCDSLTGDVTHTPLVCDDGLDCTLDACVGGVCTFTDFADIPCNGNAECPAASPGCVNAGCACPGTPTAVLEWVPVSATVQHAITGNGIDVILPPGAGAQVTLHFMVSNWDNFGTGAELSAFQGEVDATGFLGENANPPAPGVDLVPLGVPNDLALGAFQAIKVCTDDLVPPVGEQFDPLSNCQSNSDCPAGFGCVERPDWAFPNGPYINVVSTAEPNYVWGGVLTGTAQQCTPDVGQRVYGGTLILQIPPGAFGAYTIGWDPANDFTLLLNCNVAWPGNSVVPLSLVPAQINIP